MYQQIQQDYHRHFPIEWSYINQEQYKLHQVTILSIHFSMKLTNNMRLAEFFGKFSVVGLRIRIATYKV